jgi:hypothetical protein
MARSSSGPPVALWIFAALFWNGIVAVFDGVLIAQAVRENDARRRFVEVPAIVATSQVIVDTSGDGTTYAPGITYRYSYDGDEFVGDRYSFSVFSTGDRSWAREVVEANPVDAEITALVDPDDPSTSVLDVSGEAFPTFVVLFLAPFHCVGLWLIGRLVRRIRRNARGADALRARFVAVERPDHLVVRRPRVTAWDFFLFSLGGATVLAIFPLVFTFGMVGAGPYAVPALGACALVALALTAWKRARDRRPSEFLHVDRRLGLFSFPANEAGNRIEDVRGLEVDSTGTNVTINEVTQYDHRVYALLDGLEADVFFFRGAPDEGEAVRDLIADEFGVRT